MGEDDLCMLSTICNYRHHSIILGDIAPVFLGDGSVQVPSSYSTVRKPRFSGGQAAAMPIVKTRKQIQVLYRYC